MMLAALSKRSCRKQFNLPISAHVRLEEVSGLGRLLRSIASEPSLQGVIGSRSLIDETAVKLLGNRRLPPGVAAKSQPKTKIL